MKLTFSCFCWAHLSEALLGSILVSHWGTILRARVVIGAIVGARGALECFKAGGSYERLFQEGPKEFRLGSTGGRGTLHFGLTGAQLPPPGPSPSTEKERKRVDVYIKSIHSEVLLSHVIYLLRGSADASGHFQKRK